jgi:hypothetical protein
MLDKKIYDEIFSHSFTIPIKVIFWDGKEKIMDQKASLI